MCLKLKLLSYVLVFKSTCEGQCDGSVGKDCSLTAKNDNLSLTLGLTWWKEITDSWGLSSDCHTCAMACVCHHPVCQIN